MVPPSFRAWYFHTFINFRNFILPIHSEVSIIVNTGSHIWRRIHTRTGQGTGSAHSESNHVNQSPLRFGSWWDHFLVRMIFGAACVVAGYHFRPFGLNPWSAATLGRRLRAGRFVFEVRLQRVSLRRLIGAAVGSILGILGAYLMGLVLARTSIPEGSAVVSGRCAAAGDDLHRAGSGHQQGRHAESAGAGRPVRQRSEAASASPRSWTPASSSTAASPISARRTSWTARCWCRSSCCANCKWWPIRPTASSGSADGAASRCCSASSRCRTSKSRSSTTIFRRFAEVDMKLIELAKRHDAKIVTNDYNLNKVATLQGLDVLNVNQLANALEAGRAAGRGHARFHSARGQGAQSGRGLPGRRHHGGGGRRPAHDQ